MTNDNRRVFRTPTAGQSTIEVAEQQSGRGIDLIFRRSSHGEVLVRLSWSQAENLGKDIAGLTQAREELLRRIAETEAPESDEALCHDIR